MKILVALVVMASVAHAQPGEPPPPEVVPPPPMIASDGPAITAELDRAFDDFVARRYAEAAGEFDQVAATSVDPGRRATALELGRRSHVLAGLAITGRATKASNDARYGLLIGSTLVGLALYAPTVVVLESNSDSKTQVGSYMLAAGASFLVPYFATRDQDVTWGMTDAYWFGASRGAEHGALLLALFQPDNPSDQQVFGAMTLGSMLEGAGWTYWAAESHASPGMTNAITKGSDFGTAFGLAIAATINGNGDQNTRSLAAGGLIGAAAGMFGGYELAEHRNLTWGDSEVMRSAAYVGLGVAAVPLILGDASDVHVVLPVLMAGAAAGLWAGDTLLDGHHFTAGQGVVTELSTLAGAGVGAGLGYLVSDNNGDSQGKVIIVGTVLGAIGGFTLAYLGLDTTTPAASGAAPISVHIVPQITPEQKGLTIAGTF